MSVFVWVGVALLGGCGAVLRFVIDGGVASRISHSFPSGTLVVNISGSVALGFIAGLALSADAELLAGTAIVGSFTTFSTWMFESQRLAEERQLVTASTNVMVSLVLGVLAALAGQWLGGSR